MVSPKKDDIATRQAAHLDHLAQNWANIIPQDQQYRYHAGFGNRILASFDHAAAVAEFVASAPVHCWVFTPGKQTKE